MNINEHWHSIACRGLGTRGHEHTGYLPLVCKNLKLSAAVSSWGYQYPVSAAAQCRVLAWILIPPVTGRGYLLHYTKLEVLLAVANAGVTLRVLVAVVEHGLAGHGLLAARDGRHFAHGARGAVADVAALHAAAVALARRAPLHLRGAVGVHGAQVAAVRLALERAGEGVCDIVIVLLLALALHEQARPLHELVHGHGGGVVRAGSPSQGHSVVVAVTCLGWQPQDAAGWAGQGQLSSVAAGGVRPSTGQVSCVPPPAQQQQAVSTSARPSHSSSHCRGLTPAAS